MSGLTTKPGSVPASAFRLDDPFKPGSHAYAERHSVHMSEVMPGLVRVDIGAPVTTANPTAITEGTPSDA